MEIHYRVSRYLDKLTLTCAACGTAVSSDVSANTEAAHLDAMENFRHHLCQPHETDHEDFSQARHHDLHRKPLTSSVRV